MAHSRSINRPRVLLLRGARDHGGLAPRPRRADSTLTHSRRRGQSCRRLSSSRKADDDRRGWPLTEVGLVAWLTAGPGWLASATCLREGSPLPSRPQAPIGPTDRTATQNTGRVVRLDFGRLVRHIGSGYGAAGPNGQPPAYRPRQCCLGTIEFASGGARDSSRVVGRSHPGVHHYARTATREQSPRPRAIRSKRSLGIKREHHVNGTIAGMRVRVTIAQDEAGGASRSVPPGCGTVRSALATTSRSSSRRRVPSAVTWLQMYCGTRGEPRGWSVLRHARSVLPKGLPALDRRDETPAGRSGPTYRRDDPPSQRRDQGTPEAVTG